MIKIRQYKLLLSFIVIRSVISTLNYMKFCEIFQLVHKYFIGDSGADM